RTSLAGIRAGGIAFIAFPGARLRANTQWLRVMKREIAMFREIRPLTVAGAAQVGFAAVPHRFLLPVELRHANHTASTNPLILGPKPACVPTMSAYECRPDRAGCGKGRATAGPLRGAAAHERAARRTGRGAYA